jgi:TonB family protein
LVAAVLGSLLLHAGLLLALSWAQGPPAGAEPAGAVSVQVLSLAAPGGDAADAMPPQQPAPAAHATATDVGAQTASAPPSGADDGSEAETTGRASAAAPPTPKSDALTEQLATPLLPKPEARILEDPAPDAPPTTADRRKPARISSPQAAASAPAAPRAAAKPKPKPAPKAESPAPEQVSATAKRDATAAPERELSGLAALDAEIAAARKARAQDADSRQPAADGDAELSGLAALDAEIAASAEQSRGGGADSRSPTPDSGRATAKPAARTPGRSATGSQPGSQPGPEPGPEPGGRGRAERRYLAALRRALARERHYPPTARRRGLEGTARVQFTIAADGGFSGIRVSRSAGAKTLDDAAERTVRRLARFDPIPGAIGRQHWTVRVPIVFRLN